ncbi:MAG: hypothetical protein AAF696_22780 [Bacteroidota bacterium]
MSLAGDKISFTAKGTSKDFSWHIHQSYFPGGGGSIDISEDGKTLSVTSANGGSENNFTRYFASTQGLVSSIVIEHESLVNFQGYNSCIFSLRVPRICDEDGDTIANQIDTDSDGDGCPDASEGSDHFILSDLDNEDRLNSAIDNKGIPTYAGLSGQEKGASQNTQQIDPDCTACTPTAPKLIKLK